MPRTIQCNHCGVVLNLPDQAAGKRLKCPKCSAKFQIDSDPTRYPTTERSDHDASPDSSMELPPRGHGDTSLPTSAGNLRDTFDLPMLTEAASPAAPGAKTHATDALALFDERKPAPRRPSAAEARSKARRCPTCGSVVPAGMSICGKCGLDLESGTRIQLDDDLMPEAPKRDYGPPLPVTVIALVSLLGSLILGVYSAYHWYHGVAGCQYFILLCGFGAYAAVHLLRGHSAKLLIVALTLGVMINFVALIALPIFKANEQTTIKEVRPNPDDPDGYNMAIEPITERLDQQQLSLGIAIVLLYSGVCVYLVSPSVRNANNH